MFAGIFGEGEESRGSPNCDVLYSIAPMACAMSNEPCATRSLSFGRSFIGVPSICFASGTVVKFQFLEIEESIATY